jgi:AcrR family transcriptional regulator
MVAPVERIRNAAQLLLQQGGPGSLTTREVCRLAKVTAPTLYHHYGDKDGLLRAVAAVEMQAFFNRKQRMKPSDDPRRDVLRGWDDWIEFAIEHSDLVRAVQASGASAINMRQAGENIAEARLARLAEVVTLEVEIPIGARLLVASANAIVQLLLDGISPVEVRRLSTLLRHRVLEAIAPSDP